MFNAAERKIYDKLNSPPKIQDFLNSLKTNFEKDGDTCFSPRIVLARGEAHCVEGAVLAAAILRHHGFEPLLLDLESSKKDFDHVVAIFRKDCCWGAISKTNHAVLRYREPIYKTIRELVMSYFHEYFIDNGKKTLRRYSAPVNLKKFDSKNWATTEEEVWFIPEHLANVKHFDILTRAQIARLRKADEIEIGAGKLVADVVPKWAKNQFD